MNWSQEFLSFFLRVQYLKECVFLGSKLLFFLEFPKLFIPALYDWCKVQAIYIDIYLHLALKAMNAFTILNIILP